jgi:hypothetical protein
MLQPFQIEICDRTGRVLAVAEITDMSQRYFPGQLIRDDMPPALRSALQEYHEIIEYQILSLVEEAQERVRAWGLQVVGIPGRTMGARLIDFQLDSGGTLALEIERWPWLQD